jgi:CubicO group peptidase (beta-lactamase class C family)
MEDTCMEAGMSSRPTPAVSRRQLLIGAAAGTAAGLLRSPARAAGLGTGSRPLGAVASASAAGVSGRFRPRFERVYEEFVKNFQVRGEVGASVCVMWDGETVVDLWGGTARLDTGAPWQSDTLTHVWSSTKGATALCAHILASRGLLDLDAPVVQYWPEFGQQGKQGITVAMLLAHQAGLPAVREPVPAGAFYDWDLMVERLAAEAPFWEPGTRNGYHALTFGFLVGEVVRRVSGKSLGTFFHDEVATPLGLDFWIGLPEGEEPRVAPQIPSDTIGLGPTPPAFYLKAFTDPTSIPGLIVFNSGGYLNPGEADTRAAHAAEIGAAGAITNARGLAGMYAPLARSRREVELVDQDTLVRMGRVASATGQDATILAPSRFALGYVKSIDNRWRAVDPDSVILAEEAFGHLGFGGSIGFADPRARLSFGYAMNKMGGGLALNPRGQSLIDAVYQSLGYTSDVSGSWVTDKRQRR